MYGLFAMTGLKIDRKARFFCALSNRHDNGNINEHSGVGVSF